MKDASVLIQRFSRMTGIRDPKVDAWFGNQAMYAKHGMKHPALDTKREPERRSRSPMLPGPRSTKSVDEQLLEKWMDENYPSLIFPSSSYSDYIKIWQGGNWWCPSVYTSDGETYFLEDRDWFPFRQKPYHVYRYRPRGRGVITGISSYEDNPGTYTFKTDAEAEEAMRERRHQALVEQAKRLQDRSLKKVLESGFKFSWEERSEDDEGEGAEEDS